MGMFDKVWIEPNGDILTSPIVIVGNRPEPLVTTDFVTGNLSAIPEEIAMVFISGRRVQIDDYDQLGDRRALEGIQHE